jgi:carboxypeptidase D
MASRRPACWDLDNVKKPDVGQGGQLVSYGTSNFLFFCEFRQFGLNKSDISLYKVPFDVPLVAHDMLLRFQRVDVLSAVGPAAQVPSRVGDEPETVILPTQPIADDDMSGSPGAGGGNSSDVNAPGTSPTAGGSRGDSIKEAYYNAGSAALILVIIFAGLALFVWLRSRAAAKANGGGGGFMSGFRSDPVALPRRRRKKGTGDASARDGDGDGASSRRRLWGRGEAEEGEPQELDELVRGDGTADDIEDDDDDDDLEAARRRRRTGGDIGATSPGDDEEEEEAEMFSLGPDSDEEKVDGGHHG